MTDALNSQIDGNHYKRLKMQPLELAYIVGGTPCFTKLAKYITRDKGDRMINLDKAIHCIQIEEQIFSKSPCHVVETYPLLGSYTKIDQACLIVDIFSDDEYIRTALKAMLQKDYSLAIASVENLRIALNGGE